MCAQRHQGDEFAFVDVNRQRAFGGNEEGAILSVFVNCYHLTHQRRVGLGQVGKWRVQGFFAGTAGTAGAAGLAGAAAATTAAVAGATAATGVAAGAAATGSG